METIKKSDHFRWGGFPLGGKAFVYSLAVDPATNGGAYGDVMLLNTSDNNGTFEVHYSMLRGSSGFYTTGTLTHRAQDSAGSTGAWGAMTRVPTGFEWTSVNARHNYSVGVEAASPHGKGVPDSAHELTVLLSGGHAGEFDDKFIYAEGPRQLAGLGLEQRWGGWAKRWHLADEPDGIQRCWPAQARRGGLHRPRVE